MASSRLDLFGQLSLGSNTVRLRVFFLVCVIIAGIFGALTLKWTTLALQTIPGFAALAFVWFTRSQFQLPD